ncbi:MAG TPA: helix-turn-helix domain-containing protein, partial [Mycobacterium sp.]|nr:helix-turn-helix domain-containing protein [Mycobacterium sp.]
GEIVDTIRRERARRLLSGTAITLSHLARELGYAEQSVLTRSCKRWFGCGPAEYRNSCR